MIRPDMELGQLCWGKDGFGRYWYGADMPLGQYWPPEEDCLERVIKLIRKEVYRDQWVGFFA